MINRLFEFLSTLRWMPVLSVLLTAAAILAGLFTSSPALPITLAVAGLTLATLTKID